MVETSRPMSVFAQTVLEVAEASPLAALSFDYVKASGGDRIAPSAHEFDLASIAFSPFLSRPMQDFPIEDPMNPLGYFMQSKVASA